MAAEVAKQLSYSSVVQDQSDSSKVMSTGPQVSSMRPELINSTESKENVKPVVAGMNNAEQNTTEELNSESAKQEYVEAPPPKVNPWHRAGTTATPANPKEQHIKDKPKTTPQEPKTKNVGLANNTLVSNAKKSTSEAVDKKTPAKPEKEEKPEKKFTIQEALPPKVNAWTKNKPLVSTAPPTAVLPAPKTEKTVESEPAAAAAAAAAVPAVSTIPSAPPVPPVKSYEKEAKPTTPTEPQPPVVAAPKPTPSKGEYI